MRIQDLCSDTLHTIGRDATVQAAAAAMMEHHVGAIVVIDGAGHAIGVVTDRDVAVRCVAKEFDPRTMRVGEIMSEPAVAVSDVTSPEDALSLMADQEIRRVVVTALGGKAVAMLTLDDILEGRARYDAQIGRVVRGQVHAPGKRGPRTGEGRTTRS